MSNLNDIEKELKSSANVPLFEFKEQYWEDALTTLKLAEKRKRKRGAFWWWLNSLLLLVGVGAFIYFTNTTNNVKKNSSVKQSDSTKLTEHAVENTKKIASKQEHTNSKLIATNVESANKILKNEHKKQLIDNKSNTVKSNQNVSTKREILFTNKKDKAIHSKENEINKVEPLLINSTQDNSFDEKPIKPNLIIEHNKKAKMEVYTNYKLPSSLLIDKIDTNHFIKGNFPSFSKNKKLMLSVNFGVLASASFNENKIGVDAPYLGGELTYQLTNKMNISLGGGWYTKSNVNYFITSTTETYGFGGERKTSVTSLEKIYFFEIPLKINYQFKTNHLIGIGGATSFVLGGKNRIWENSLTVNSYGTETSENEKEQLVNGYTNTYTANSYSLFLSYEYRYKRWGGELRYYQGLNDITINEIVLKNQIDRNSRILVTLKYLILK